MSSAPLAAAFTALLIVFAPTGLTAQQSHCADCHFANPGAPGAEHLSDWDRSAHGRESVGCERCHGGNEQTFESLPAHRGIIDPADARSPVHRANLPMTCGACHAGPFVAFQRSRHYELLKMGDRNAPTCSTCHGEVAAELPSPKALESQCQRCHGERGTAPRPGHAAQGRQMIEGIRETRALLKEADSAIKRVRDQARRDRLRAEADQVRVPLVQAADSGHAFVFDQLEERLSVARTRLASLLEQLANPTP